VNLPDGRREFAVKVIKEICFYAGFPFETERAIDAAGSASGVRRQTRLNLKKRMR